MASFMKFNSNMFKQVIQMCTIFLFRYLTIGKQESKDLEKLFSRLAIDIRTEKIDDIETVRSQLSDKDIKDESFRSLLDERDLKEPSICKYILKKIENHLDPMQEKFSSRITLEHILPKKPNEEWDIYLQQQEMRPSDWIHKLGNMTLLLGNVNSRLQNKFITEKTESYRESSTLKINKDLVNLTGWTQKNIETRQRRLIDTCMKIWKL